MKVDLAVIGAGPAGLTVAREVSKTGFNVSVLEKDPTPGKNAVCAGNIGYSYIRALHVPDQVIQKRIYGSVVYLPWGMKERCTATCESVNVYRSDFGSFLAEETVKNGAKVDVSAYAFNVSRAEDLVDVHVKDRETGKNYNVHSEILVFADGPNTMVAKKFGIGFKKHPNNTAHAAIYEMEWKNNGLYLNEFYFDQKVSPWGYGWIFPKKDTVNVGVACLLSKIRNNIRDYLDYLVKRHPAASRKLKGKKICKFAVDIIPLSHAKTIYDERILVIGDAAGMVDPIWGGGINHAINSGKMAAGIIIEALEKGDCSRKCLSRFQERWKKSIDYKKLRSASFWSKVIFSTIYEPMRVFYTVPAKLKTSLYYPFF